MEKPVKQDLSQTQGQISKQMLDQIPIGYNTEN